MRRYAVIGKPVSHSLSPAMQQAAFDAAGIQASYEAIEAAAGDPITGRLRALGYAGWNVTTPLKEQIAREVDELTDAARRVRAVNVVRRDGDRLVGHNTDGAGFVRAVQELWPDRALSGVVLLLGSGPAARAIACALRDAGVNELFCWARDERRALALGPPPRSRPTLAAWAMPPEASMPAQIVALVQQAPLFFDCNYGLKRAMLTSIGQTSDGLPMLLHQGALSFEWWTGELAPLNRMRAALA